MSSLNKLFSMKHKIFDWFCLFFSMMYSSFHSKSLFQVQKKQLEYPSIGVDLIQQTKLFENVSDKSPITSVYFQNW